MHCIGKQMSGNVLRWRLLFRVLCLSVFSTGLAVDYGFEQCLVKIVVEVSLPEMIYLLLLLHCSFMQALVHEKFDMELCVMNVFEILVWVFCCLGFYFLHFNFPHCSFIAKSLYMAENLSSWKLRPAPLNENVTWFMKLTSLALSHWKLGTNFPELL